MPADWSSPVAFDGTETLQIQANPRAGSVNSYHIPFAAMWTSRSFGTFPVNIEFDGSETVDLAVETQDGDSHTLTLSFGALSLTLDQADDPAPFLTALASHVTAAIPRRTGTYVLHTSAIPAASRATCNAIPPPTTSG